MAEIVLLITEDDALAETFGEKFRLWGMKLIRRNEVEDAMGAFFSMSVDVVLLDIRRRGEETVGRLRNIGLRRPHPEVFLLNRLDNVSASIAGMLAGATEELTEPFCTKTLQRKIRRAGSKRPRRRGRGEKRRRGILAEFSAAMSAAAFAQAGEFDAAVELYKEDGGQSGEDGPRGPDGGRDQNQDIRQHGKERTKWVT